MASSILYPPVIDSYMPAFVASTGYCRLYFALSRFSTTTNIQSVHVTVVKQTNGQSVVNKTDNATLGRYRSTGIIIINDAPQPGTGEMEGLYYIDILNQDVTSGDSTGFIPGWIYKFQIRLATVAYPGNIGQTTWLNENANNFSEWSTYCTSKAIGAPTISIPILTVTPYTSSSMNIIGDISFGDDKQETLYSYDFTLKQNNTILEQSDILYSDQYHAANQFNYQLRTVLLDNTTYQLLFHYITINKYEATVTYTITVDIASEYDTAVSVLTVDSLSSIADTSYVNDFKSKTTKDKEEDNGRIGLKLYLDSNTPQTHTYYIRRASSKDDFAIWEDIKCIVVNNCIINSLPIFYDNTIESGIWYKYGVEELIDADERKNININNTLLLREFMYSFLIGENGRQLKLEYNNTMGNYTYTLLENKQDTLGGIFPFITKNGNTKYRTFPINGLISFNMDKNNLFTSDTELYKYQDVITAYQNRRRNENISLYDFKREHDFREKVLEFLQNGKPKLFKSATEGNIIVRLMQVAEQPTQSLNRMIGSFTSTAYEVAEDSIKNYKKYNFIPLVEFLTEDTSTPNTSNAHSEPVAHTNIVGG